MLISPPHLTAAGTPVAPAASQVVLVYGGYCEHPGPAPSPAGSIHGSGWASGSDAGDRDHWPVLLPLGEAVSDSLGAYLDILGPGMAG